MSNLRFVHSSSLDRWDLTLRAHLHYVLHRTAERNGGWLPAIPKDRTAYLERKFRGNWMVVRCGESGWDFHVVAVSRKGRLALLDHPNWRREKAFAELGGPRPNCLHVALSMFVPAYREYFGDFPKRLNAYCHEQANKRSRRRGHGVETNWPWAWYVQPRELPKGDG